MYIYYTGVPGKYKHGCLTWYISNLVRIAFRLIFEKNIYYIDRRFNLYR